jgi:pimeloyl-ACP methyl ester carboxylesterase
MSTEAISTDPSIRFDYVQVGDVRLHYAEHGAGREQLVLLLHGFPECWYSWRNQLTIFGDRLRVVAPDLRGYNMSDKPAHVSDYKISKLIDDVTGLIIRLGHEQAIIVGHDWGAAIAWAVAAKYPSYVRKLAALQAPPPAAWRRNMTFAQALRSWYMLFFQLPRIPEWWIARNDFRELERAFSQTAWRRWTFSERDVEVYKNAFRHTGALTPAINYYRANVPALLLPEKKERIENAPLFEDISDGRIRVPTLFIYGERDFAIIPQTVRNVGDFVDAPYREVRIATAGHWVQQEAVQEVNAALRSFVEDDSI